jgi:8-oxo-dGTP diphosphatase
MKKRYVLGFLFDPDWECVVLIRKSRSDWQRGKLNGIGGKIEPGEVPSEAMRREFREEANVLIGHWTYFAAMQFLGEEVFCFYAAGTEIAWATAITDEPLAICALDDLPDDCLPNVHWLVQMAKSHHRYRRTYAHEVFEDAIACAPNIKL